MQKSKQIILSLPKKDFETLYKMICVADRIINDIRNQDEELPEYKKIFRNFLKFIYESGLHHLAEYDPGLQDYFPTQAFDNDDTNEVTQLIHDYDEDLFWEELKYRYFDLLYMKKHGEKKMIGKMRVNMILEESALFQQVEDAIEESGLGAFELTKIKDKDEKPDNLKK